MKRICQDILAIVILINIAIAISCSTQKAGPEPNRAYFEIDSLYKMITLPVTINDTVTARMAFDTGTRWGYFDLDSTFCASHPLHLWQQAPSRIRRTGGIAWVNELPRGNSFIYEKDFTVKIRETNIEYERLVVWNAEGYVGKVSHNGIFTIPQSDTARVWELNFEHNYLELHEADTFTMPEDCLITPIIAGDPDMKITIPMQITTSDGETLIVNQDFLVDTGMGWDIAFTPPAEEVSFFEGKEAVPFHYGGGGYVNRHIVDAEILGNFHIDSLRIYVLKEQFRLPACYWVGLNFLKRFNVFIDVKNSRMGLQPLKEFHRAFSPVWKRFSIGLSKTDRGSYMVTELADHDLNHYKAAGIEVGDEIVGINGCTLTPDTTQEKEGELLNTFKVVFDVIRDDRHINITMERDPNEIHGD